MLKAKMLMRLHNALKRKPKKEDSLANSTSLLIKVKCPTCGVSCVGSAAEVVAWRAEHRCRPSERTKSLRVLPEHAG
jgi:hypothetical protein